MKHATLVGLMCALAACTTPGSSNNDPPVGSTSSSQPGSIGATSQTSSGVSGTSTLGSSSSAAPSSGPRVSSSGAGSGVPSSAVSAASSGAVSVASSGAVSVASSGAVSVASSGAPLGSSSAAGSSLASSQAGTSSSGAASLASSRAGNSSSAGATSLPPASGGWVVWRPTVGTNNGDYTLSGLNHPITARATLDSTPGQERFVDEAGETLPLLGVHMTFNGVAPLTQTEAQNQAKLMASQGVNFIRMMNFDEPSRIYQDTNGSRCSWWKSLSGWGSTPADVVAQIDEQALDRMNYFLAQLKAAGIRVALGFDRTFVVSQGRGRPVGGMLESATPERPYGGWPWMGQWWQEPLLSDIKDYFTALFSIYNPYTGMTWGQDPVFLGAYLFNEQSIMKVYLQGNAAGTRGLDKNFKDNSAYVAGWDADYAQWHQDTYGEAPFSDRNPDGTGNGQVKFPTRAFDDTSRQRPLYANLSPEARQRFCAYLLAKQRQSTRLLKQHLQTVAPGLLVSGITNSFGWNVAETEADFQDVHFYNNYPAQGSPDFVDPRSANIASASITNKLLTVVLQAEVSNGEPDPGKYVKLENLTGGTGFNPNGTWVIKDALSTTSFTIDLTSSNPNNQTFIITNSGTNISKVTLAARLLVPHGQSWLNHSNMSAYFSSGGGQQLAGKPLVVSELASRGMSDRDNEHHIVVAAHCLLQGWSGFVDFDWGVGTAYFVQGRIVGDEDALAHPGRRITRMLAALMLHHNVLQPADPVPFLADMSDTGFIQKVSTEGAPRYIASWYPDFSSQWQSMYNHGKRIRLNVIPTGPITIPASMGPTTEPFLSGGTQVRWIKSARAPVGGTTPLSGRLEFVDSSATSRISGATGLLGNGTYGKLVVSGLPDEGYYGTIIWVTRDGSPLGQGESMVFAYGPSANADFQWLDEDHRQYMSYGSGPPAIHLPAATVTLSTGATSPSVVGISADGVGSGVPSVHVGNTVKFNTGTAPMFHLPAP